MADPTPDAAAAAQPPRRRAPAARRGEDAAPTKAVAEPARSEPGRRRSKATERDPAADTTPAPGPAPKVRASRAVNQIGAAVERSRAPRPDAAREETEVGQPGGPPHRPGDVPQSLTRRYFTEALKGGATVAFYEGPGAKKVAFHDHGSRLATDQSHPAVIRDLAAIAAHRGWRSVQVKGADDFRRELWLEARSLGLDVRGYKPRERDQQELDRRLEQSAERSRGTLPKARENNGAGPPQGPTPPDGRVRPDFDAGVTGKLLASGEAPYRRRTGEPTTAYIRIDRGDGRALDVWGAGLPQALARSGAQIGDVVQVRREGVDVVQRTVEVRDPRTGMTSPQVRDVTRNRWIIEAERFRRASPSEAARDVQLRGAQSHLAVLNTVIDRSIKDPEGRARLRAEAREIVADELAQGRRFTPARIREVEPVLARDVGQAHAREAAAERVHRR